MYKLLKLIILVQTISIVVFLNIFYYSYYNNHIKNTTDVSWVGDTIVWNDFNYITQDEALRKLRSSRLLLIGDSLSRRLGFTLYTFLNFKNPTRSQLNKDHMVHRTVKHVIESHNINITSRWVPLMKDYNDITTDALSYDYILVSIGLHDSYYVKHKSYNMIEQFVQKVRSDVYKFDNIYVRICPSPDYSKASNNRTIIDTINNRLRDNIPQNRLIDTQKILEQRDFGKTRIKGNTRDHFGPPARIAILQSVLISIL